MAATGPMPLGGYPVRSAEDDGTIAATGTAATKDVSFFATAAQGAVADTALQPAGSGASLTALNASALASGTVPDARFPSTLPAKSGVNLTALNATQLTSGTIPDARYGATAIEGIETAASITPIGDNTYYIADGTTIQTKKGIIIAITPP